MRNTLIHTETCVLFAGLLGVGYQKYGSHQAMTTDAMQHLFDVSPLQSLSPTEI